MFFMIFLNLRTKYFVVDHFQVYTSPQLAGVSLMIVPPIVIVAMLYGRYVRKITKQVQDTLAESSQVAEERFSNIRTVRAFGQELRETERYNSKIDKVFLLAKKEALAKAAFFGYVSFVN